MSFKRHVVASYVSQIYTTLIGIVIVPVYIRYMGAEAYGLIGFYAMLQAWFQLLDMGLAPTISRETARFRGGAIDAQTLRKLLRALECIFYSVALIGAFSLILASDAIATRWLKVEHLPLSQVRYSIELMAGIIGLRWIAGLYRGAIGGFEEQPWLGKLNVVMATARFVVVIAIFEYLGTTPLLFFAYQLFVGVVETFVLAAKTYRLMPKLSREEKFFFSLGPLVRIMKFSLSVAFTGSVWIFVTQTDKLVLSKILPLSSYAYFTLAVLVASGVNIMSGPISNALMPRLSRLYAEGNVVGAIDLYRGASQFVAVIATSIACVLFFFAEPLLIAWTGDLEKSLQAAPILRLYALGNGFLALGAFPYYLQFAKGDLKLHLIGNFFFLVLLIPAIVGAASLYGAVGAGWAWLLTNVLYFIAWVPIVHHRLAPGMHVHWLLRDIVPVLIATATASLIAFNFFSLPSSRAEVAVFMSFVSVFVLVIGGAASKKMRGVALKKILYRL